MKHLRVLFVLASLSVAAFGLPAFGHSVFGQSMAGPFAPATAAAEGPASSSPVTSRFLGFVVADAGEPLPTKVRALGVDGVVCGTTSVSVVEADLGFYNLEVVGDAWRDGCPDEGDEVSFILLYGNVGGGASAVPNAEAVFQAGATSVVSLGTPDAFGVTGWSGEAPRSGGSSILRWNGPSGVPVAEAVSLLRADVTGVWHFDAGSGSMLAWVPEAPSFVQTYEVVGAGDVVLVRVR